MALSLLLAPHFLPQDVLLVAPALALASRTRPGLGVAGAGSLSVAYLIPVAFAMTLIPLFAVGLMLALERREQGHGRGADEQHSASGQLRPGGRRAVVGDDVSGMVAANCREIDVLGAGTLRNDDGLMIGRCRHRPDQGST